MLISWSNCVGCGHRFPGHPDTRRVNLLCNVCRKKAEALTVGHNLDRRDSKATVRSVDSGSEDMRS